MAQISKEYAAALFAIAEEKNRTVAWSESLKQIAEILQENPRYLALLASPEIPPEERKSLLDQAFGGMADPEVISFMALICRRGRAKELPEAITHFRQLADIRTRTRVARVVSAAPLTEQEKKRLTAALEKQSGMKVTLSCAVDPSLIGGLTVEMDGRVTDGSVRTRLREIKEVIGG
ncbi:MAG: ATP synthase F1 subunit delta [Clostridia bacterium]|nr:ATP synthase F1 subunit delta [Clostridia bacterium]